MQTLQTYITNRQHYGNELYAARFVYGNRTKNTLLTTKTPQAFDDVNLLFKTIAFIYKQGWQKFPVDIKTNKVTLCKLFKILPYWQKNGWVASSYTTKQLYQKGVKSTKVPKNYGPIVPVLERILKASQFFKAGLHITYITNSVRDNQFQILKNFTVNQAEQLPPTKAFHDANVKRIKQESNQHVTCQLTFNIDSNLKNRFIKALQENNELSSKVLSKAIAEYVVQKGRH